MASTKHTSRRNVGGQAPARAPIHHRAAKKLSLALDGIRLLGRYRQGARALMDIRKHQRSTNLLIKKRPFQLLVRGISQNFKSCVRFQAKALLALQEASEAFVIQLFEDTYCAPSTPSASRSFPRTCSSLVESAEDGEAMDRASVCAGELAPTISTHSLIIKLQGRQPS